MEKMILTFQQGCDLLQLKPSYVYKLTSGGILPYSRPNGGKIYFERDKLEEWMLSHSRPGSVERDVQAATYVASWKRKGGLR